MHKSDPLVRTKLRTPFIREGRVARPRLSERIAEGLRGPFTLITAPAGFGKTTLAATCVEGCGMPVAWVALDKEDNQVERFLSYMIAAFAQLDGACGAEAAQLLTSPQPVPLEIISTSLINDLDAAMKEMVLVLDDYQFIMSQAVHNVLVFLLEHQPQTLHIVLATRSDPPLPLARLRARGQLVELRAADLRFTVSEATQFLNEVMSLKLDPDSASALAEHTEGWIAGLQMAALSLRDREDVPGFLQKFSGSNRYIMDYLLEEVLNTQPPDVQRFLLSTSILDRMTAPLCDVVLNGHAGLDAEPAIPRPSTAILEHLERANLFLISLDDERRWYRYHHLFADLLRARLQHQTPGLVPRLHERAGQWFENNGMFVESINHALAAGNHQQAARLVEENTIQLLARGEIHALTDWIEVLPEETRRARPWLCIHQAYALAFAGQLEKIETLLNQAEVAIQRDGGSRTDIDLTKDQKALAGAVTALRAMAAVMTGGDTEAIHLANQAEQLLPEESLWDRAAAAWALGYAQRSLGHLPEARAAFQEQIRLGRAMGNIWTLVTGLNDLAQVRRNQGRLHEARALLEEALSEAAQQGARSLGYMNRIEGMLAGILYEQNELESAEQLLSQATGHIRLWPNPNHLVYIAVLQARLLRAQGRLEQARQSLEEADLVRRSASLTRVTRRIVEVELVRLGLAWQAAGMHTDPADGLFMSCSELVSGWRQELEEHGDQRLDECCEMAGLTLVRADLACGAAETALASLARLTEHALEAGSISTAIESLLLTALAYSQILANRPVKAAVLGGPAAVSGGPAAVSGSPAAVSGSPVSGAQALAAFEQALRLAEPGGYVRVFLDEGPPVQMLLAQWVRRANADRLCDYAANLLAAFDASPGGAGAVQPEEAPRQSLVEPLSPRELEVLSHISQGLSNDEIARQLVISPGTVKAHTASIYRKLDVVNRTQAVARARQLHLLP